MILEILALSVTYFVPMAIVIVVSGVVGYWALGRIAPDLQKLLTVNTGVKAIASAALVSSLFALIGVFSNPSARTDISDERKFEYTNPQPLPEVIHNNYDEVQEAKTEAYFQND
jgi:hypothetical protein